MDSPLVTTGTHERVSRHCICLINTAKQSLPWQCSQKERRSRRAAERTRRRAKETVTTTTRSTGKISSATIAKRKGIRLHIVRTRTMTRKTIPSPSSRRQKASLNLTRKLSSSPRHSPNSRKIRQRTPIYQDPMKKKRIHTSSSSSLK